ncbi:MAG TPA: hypothetical protein PLO78_00280 [Candidatus Omnitrophota bacterium]|nr:hypothetical protein [Candidatus Omnitrophota bacterium]
MSSSSVSCEKNTLEAFLKKEVEDFALQNRAARIVARGLSLIGVGFRPVFDHIVFRTADIRKRAQEFLPFGYVKDASTRILLTKSPHVEVYRKEGYPAVMIEQAHHLPAVEWLNTFGEMMPYYLALQVDHLEDAAFSLEKQGIAFLRPESGGKGDHLRQIAAVPEMKGNQTATTIVLVERHAGDTRFYAPDFWIHPQGKI